MSDVRNDIVKLRTAIRKHRDAKGDDRCWIDDYFLYELIPDSPTWKLKDHFIEEGLKECRCYFQKRSTKDVDRIPTDAIADEAKWDADLETMSHEQLVNELTSIRNAIAAHRNIATRDKTVDDDRSLYAILPEKIPADFRLPSEDAFLGRANPHAGCPNFWDSHASCSANCNLHQWGPCR